MTQSLTISRRWSAAAAPRPTIPPQEWCEKVRRMKNGARFRWNYAPYLLKPFLSFYDPVVQATIMEMFSRAGKSEIVLNWMGEGMDQRGGRFLVLWPTVGQAEKWSKDNLTGELLDETPCLQKYGSSAKSRHSGNTILHKSGAGWLMTAFGANSPGEMRRSKGDKLYDEECDAIRENEAGEGDPLSIFDKRGDEYPNVTRISACYPSLVGRSRIHAKMELSDFQEYYSTCVICGGEPYIMHRKMVVYDDHSPQEARLLCPRCKNLLTDPQRHAMMLQGNEMDCWRPTREFRGIRGFHANSMLWPHPVDKTKFPGGFMEMLARKMIAAERADKPKSAMQPIVNTEDAEPFDPQSEDEKPPEWKALYELREDYGQGEKIIVPKDALVVTAAVDVHKNRLEVEWEGLGRNECVWGIDHVTLWGEVQDMAVWKELEKELLRELDHAIGCKVSLSLAFVDAGRWGDWVYRFLRYLAESGSPLRGRIYACRGSSTFPHSIVDKTYKSIAKNLKGFWVGGDAAKDLIYTRLRKSLAPSTGEFQGRRRFPLSYSETYFQQLVSERATIVYVGAEELRKYDNSDHVRNETLDLAVYNLAVQRIRNWQFDQVQSELETKAMELLGKIAPQPEQLKSRMRKTTGFI